LVIGKKDVRMGSGHYPVRKTVGDKPRRGLLCPDGIVPQLPEVPQPLNAPVGIALVNRIVPLGVLRKVFTAKNPEIILTMPAIAKTMARPAVTEDAVDGIPGHNFTVNVRHKLK